MTTSPTSASSANQAYTAMFGAAYDFGLARGFAQYARVKEENTATAATNTTDKIYQVGATVPVQAVAAVLVSYSRAQTEGALSGDRRFISVGYDYRLSKRTDLYAVLMTDKYSALRRGDSFGVGVRHVF